jgi:hypothetical protein
MIDCLQPPSKFSEEPDLLPEPTGREAAATNVTGPVEP